MQTQSRKLAMTDKSNVDHLEKLQTEKLTSLAEDSSNELAEADAYQTDREKNRANRSSNTAKSKREIMEELSRERFPWEE